MGLVIAACNGSDLTRTENVFDATHVARLTGVVTTQSGQPLDSVRVSISIPATADYRYADESVLTNADGRYTVTVRRTVAPAQVASPDTVRVPIVSLTLRPAHRAADGRFTGRQGEKGQHGRESGAQRPPSTRAAASTSARSSRGRD